MKSCGRFIRKYRGMRIRCGRSQKIGDDKVIKETCDRCKTFNEGWMAGYKERIKKNKRCQALTCNRAAKYVVCEKEFLIDVCRGHVGIRETSKIINDYNENKKTI